MEHDPLARSVASVASDSTFGHGGGDADETESLAVSELVA